MPPSAAVIGIVIHGKLFRQLFDDPTVRRLESLGRVLRVAGDDPAGEDEAAALLAECDVAIGSWNTPRPTPRILAAAPRLRLWEHVAGTVKGFFGPHLQGRDLTIASCKGAIADSVAEMVLGELILGLRRVPENSAANRRGRAGKPANLRTLADSTVGVIAASEVGRRVCRLLQPFGTRVLLHDPFVDAAGAAALGAELAPDLLDLCRRVDAITLHPPLLPATRHLLRAEHFRALRDDAVVINTSRGPCLDEAALVAELERGRLVAFLDVSDPEPAADDSPLRRLPNVIYTSHIAGPPGFHLGRRAADDIAAFLAGGQPQCVVTPDLLDRIA